MKHPYHALGPLYGYTVGCFGNAPRFIWSNRPIGTFATGYYGHRA